MSFGEFKKADSAPTGPRLAVVIPCYNYEHYVGRAIESVRNQARSDCELVVVDDGSTDGSWEIISQLDVRAYRIDNSGSVRACLYGLDRTTAPFVLFLDADDELKPGALQKVVELLDPQVAKLQFSLTRIDAQGREIHGAEVSVGDYRKRTELIAQVLRNGVYQTPPTSGNVFRRDVCELLREIDYEPAIDGAMLFAAPFFGDVMSVSDQLGRYRVHDRNDSGVGRGVDARRLERDMARFLARMGHLDRIRRRLGVSGALANASQTLYFRELQYCSLVISGQRPSVRTLIAILKRLAGEDFPIRKKITLMAFYMLSAILPRERAKNLLNYRFKIGKRSFRGFLNEPVSPA